MKTAAFFYTALYHAMLLPRVFSDASGTYPRFGGGQSIEKTNGRTYYDDFSIWDTFARFIRSLPF